MTRREAHGGRWRALIAPAVAVYVLAGGGLLSCDPCGATFECKQSHRVALVGAVVDHDTGEPASGTRVIATYDSGVTLSPPQLETTTDASGYFELESRAAEVGVSYVHLTIATPGQAPYVIANINARALGTTGDANVLPPVVSSRPEIPYVVSVSDSVTAAPAAGAYVQFTQTGGHRLVVNGKVVPSVQEFAGPDGHVFLFESVTTDTTGMIVGDFLVRRTPNSAPVVFRGARLTGEARFRTPHAVVSLLLP